MERGRVDDFIEIVAPCVSGVLESRESGAEVASDSEGVDICVLFFLCSVYAPTDIAFGSVSARRANSTAASNIFVQNFVFVHKFTSKIVRIIAFEPL